VRLGKLHGDRELPQCQRMLNFTDLASVPNGVALGELQGAEQVELDSAGDVPDGRLAGPAPGCPRVDAWPLVTVRQAPGRGGDVPECGRRSARLLPGP
jgi:hypothetical protein